MILLCLISVTMPMKEEVRDWALLTSLKGVPRAIKSKLRVLKVIWYISTALFVLLALYHVILLTVMFLHYDFTTQFHEEDFEIKSEGNAPIYLPSVTICNLNPFSGNASSAMATLGLPRLATFRDVVRRVTECDGCPDDNLNLLLSEQHELMTSHGYFSHIGRNNAAELGHSQENFIVGCFLLEKQGFRSHKKPCSQVTFKSFISPDFYNCWIVDFTRYRHQSVTGIMLVLHLDNFYEAASDTLSIFHDEGRFNGALVAFHNHGTFPPLQQNPIFLHPGSFSDVKVHLSRRQRLGEPYNRCTKQEFVDGSEWLYTRTACVSACLERLITDRCDCKDIYALGVLDHAQNNLSFCSDPFKGQKHLLQKSRCASDLRQRTYTNCLSNCPPPCNDVSFQTDISTATWPPNAHLEDFYQTFVTDRPYAWRYGDISDMTKPNSAGAKEDMLVINDLVQSNFLRVDISLEDLDYPEYVDKPKTTVATFLSNIGGTLNFFTGISVGILVEFVDLFIRLCYKKENDRKQKLKKQEQSELDKL